MDNTTSNQKRENFISGVKVPETVRPSILDKPLYTVNDSKNLELYNDFVTHQKEPFKAIMFYFNDMLTQLKQTRKDFWIYWV